MKYISLDVETTGLRTSTSQVIELAMVYEDTEKRCFTPVDELPHLRVLFRHDKIIGEFYALNMNIELLKEAEDEGQVPEVVWQAVANWLLQIKGSDKLVLAGKNVGKFDFQFLPEYVRRLFSHRFIDPGSVFIDWKLSGPRSLGDILGTTVSHTALEDARDVVRVLRRSYQP